MRDHGVKDDPVRPTLGIWRGRQLFIAVKTGYLIGRGSGNNAAKASAMNLQRTKK
jgi:hypothetical protein